MIKIINMLSQIRSFFALFVHVFYWFIFSRHILNKYSFCQADLYIDRLLCNYYSVFHEYVPIDSLRVMSVDSCQLSVVQDRKRCKFKQT